MLTQDELTAWLTAAFPDQPGWIIRDHQSAHSFQQQMDRVTLVWPNPQTTSEVFVRVYRSYLSWWTLITPDLPQRERTAWTIARRGGVPVAPILYHGTHANVQGAVISLVPGSTGWVPHSPSLVIQLADTLARLHTAPIHSADRAHLPDCTLTVLLSRLAAWAEELPAAHLRNDLRTIEQRLAHIQERSATLVHGDCHPGNILIDGERVTAVIDWEEAALGDPHIDICWLASAIRHQDASLADQFLRTYEAQTGYTVGDLQVWSALLEVRYQIVHAWIKHALAQGRSLPSANPEAWPD
jgi:aminoglycoside phosphotransferase (APT) family kinase protein